MREVRHGSARLLVVDDNKVNRLLLGRSLELQGHSVAAAENGRVAIEMLRRENFDLMLLDMEMPEMDGFQVLEQMANDLQLRDIPVIVTSSLEGIDHGQVHPETDDRPVLVRTLEQFNGLVDAPLLALLAEVMPDEENFRLTDQGQHQCFDLVEVHSISHSILDDLRLRVGHR